MLFSEVQSRPGTQVFLIGLEVTTSNPVRSKEKGNRLLKLMMKTWRRPHLTMPGITRSLTTSSMMSRQLLSLLHGSLWQYQSFLIGNDNYMPLGLSNSQICGDLSSVKELSFHLSFPACVSMEDPLHKNCQVLLLRLHSSCQLRFS